MSQEKEIKGFLVSKTDPKGKITYCNQAFIEVSGFGESELLGKPHSIVRHPDMPRIAFRLLWESIESGREFFAFVKNLSKQQQAYWVFANITPSYNSSGEMIGYYSVRRCPSKEGVKTLEGVYKQLLEAEKEGGMESSLKTLQEILARVGMSYEGLCVHLQEQGRVSGWYGCV